MPDPLIQLDNVRRTYQLGETEQHALDGVDLTINKGEIVFIRGPSGAGKSTILNQIALLDTPTSGKVHFMGQDAGAISDAERTRLRGDNIGVIFQSFNLVPVLSSVENVTLPMIMGANPPKDAQARALAFLEEVGVGEHAHKRVTLLSGGQRQRVAIARALIQNPALIVADEPTANLDSENSAKVLSLMLRLNQEHGTTMVVATHDQDVRATASREIVMKDGRVASDSAPAALAAE